MDIAVDRVYFSGIWDSNGHEEIRTRRYHCKDAAAAEAVVRELLSLAGTRLIRILTFNRFRNCFEVLSIVSPDSPGASDFRMTLPVGCKDRDSIQSVLF